MKWIVPNNLLLNKYFSDCAVITSKPFGVITSPGYPQSYQNGVDCTWLIQLPIGQLLEMIFLQFQLDSFW